MTGPEPISDAAMARLMAEAAAEGTAKKNGEPARRAPGDGAEPNRGLRWALMILSGTRQRSTYRLPRQGSARVGRAADNWICLDRDDEVPVSQHHARITVDGEAIRIQDLESTNGTYVNGLQLGPDHVELKEGDVIQWAQCARAMVVRVEREKR